MLKVTAEIFRTKYAAIKEKNKFAFPKWIKLTSILLLKEDKQFEVQVQQRK